MKSIFKTLRQGTGIVLAVQVSGLATRYISYVLLARWMGAADYGDFIYSFTWVQSLSTLAALGMANVTLRFMNEYQARKEPGLLRGLINRARLLSVIGGLAFAGIGAFVIWILASQGIDHLAYPVLWVGMGLVPLQSLLGIQVEILRGHGHLGRALLPPLVLQGVFQAVFSGLWFRQAGELNAIQAMISLALSFLLCLIFQEIMIKHEAHQTGITAARPVYATRQWLSISLPMLSSLLIMLVFSQSDLLVVGSLFSSTEAGLYAAAAKTAALVTFPLTAMTSYGAPMIARHFSHGDSHGLQTIVQLTSRWAFLPSLGIAMLFILFGSQFLGLFGKEFKAAGTVLNLLVIGQLVNAWTGPVNTLLDLTGNERRRAGILAIFAIINFSLVLGFSLLLNSSGTALGKALGIAGLNLTLAWMVKKQLAITSPAFFPIRQ